MCHACLTRRSFLRKSVGATATLAAAPWALRMPRWAEVADSERPYLEAALKAWRWIESTRQITEHGVTWPADPDDPGSIGTTLYTHSPGVLPFALELFHVTQDERFLDAARAGADHLGSQLTDVEGAGLYVGLAGLAFVFEEMYRASGDLRYRHLAERGLETLIARARPAGEGSAWPTLVGDGEAVESNDIVSGTAGTGLTLLYLHARTGSDAALETAVRAGYRLTERGTEVDAGRKWDMWPGYPREMPNFSHGTAGIAYFLATLADRTGESVFRDAAVAGARYLKSIATLRDDGYRIHHHTPGGEDLYYLAWCHGPVGTNRLFHRLGELTGDVEWQHWVHRGARGIMATGVPERRTPGFWENISQCGGDAGLGEFFLAMNRLTGEPSYRSFAERLNASLLSRSTERDGGLKWIQSEHRVQPELLVAQTGFMQGAAGVGKYFLHMDAMETRSAGPVILLPDAPY
jgi:lantibiotic modifying enzyme